MTETRLNFLFYRNQIEIRQKTTTCYDNEPIFWLILLCDHDWHNFGTISYSWSMVRCINPFVLYLLFFILTAENEEQKRKKKNLKTVGWQTLLSISCLIWIYIFFVSLVSFSLNPRELIIWFRFFIFFLCYEWAPLKVRLQRRYNWSVCNFKWHDIDWVELLYEKRINMQLSFCFFNKIIVSFRETSICVVSQKITRWTSFSPVNNDIDLLFAVKCETHEGSHQKNWSGTLFQWSVIL